MLGSDFCLKPSLTFSFHFGGFQDFERDSVAGLFTMSNPNRNWLAEERLSNKVGINSTAV
jgi:hypothetical protein